MSSRMSSSQLLRSINDSNDTLEDVTYDIVFLFEGGASPNIKTNNVFICKPYLDESMLLFVYVVCRKASKSPKVFWNVLKVPLRQSCLLATYMVIRISAKPCITA